MAQEEHGTGKTKLDASPASPMRRQVPRTDGPTAPQGCLIGRDVGCLTSRAGVENRALETGEGRQKWLAFVDVEICGWLWVLAIGKGVWIYEAFWNVD